MRFKRDVNHRNTHCLSSGSFGNSPEFWLRTCGLSVCFPLC